ncbi:MAG: DUF3999 domain-containing protein, partial [Nevskiaceae bacterium]|nr:DUF3999 domain-containing protein [Nevskiaceae bacterium]
MRTCERRRIQSLAALALTGVFAGGVCLDASAQEEASQDLLRWQAPIVIEQSGAFVQLPLPAQVYTHSAQSNLADLRVVDARGERVPFALLSTPLTSASDSAASAPREVTTPAKLYPLPPLPGDAKAADGIELSIVEGRVSVRTAGVTASVTMGTAASATAVSPGWLIDLGEDDRSQGNGEGNGGDPPPRPYALQLNWSGPAEFSAGFTLTSSADLREWHGAGAGQVMALTSSDGALTQPLVNLPR